MDEIYIGTSLQFIPYILFLTIKTIIIMPYFKKKPASLIGAPISAQECQQLKAAYNEKYPDQTPSVFLSKELILNSIQGLSNVSGILFSYGLDDAANAASRRITLVPTRNADTGESAIINIISENGYISNNGERIDLEQLLMLLANHVTNFKSEESEMPLTRLPRDYFWGINKIEQLLEVDNCAGLMFHFGFNTEIPTRCRQFQNVLEVVDANHKSLNVFMEYGQCRICDGDGCFYTIAAERFLTNAEAKLNVLRSFRDNWLLQQQNGQALFERYYFLSPGISAEIKHRADQESIWNEIYTNDFSNLVSLIEQNKFEEAQAFYISSLHNLANRYLVQEAEVLA